MDTKCLFAQYYWRAYRYRLFLSGNTCFYVVKFLSCADKISGGRSPKMSNKNELAVTQRNPSKVTIGWVLAVSCMSRIVWNYLTNGSGFVPPTYLITPRTWLHLRHLATDRSKWNIGLIWFIFCSTPNNKRLSTVTSLVSVRVMKVVNSKSCGF